MHPDHPPAAEPAPALKPPRARAEAELSDAVAAELRQLGRERVVREYALPGGIADVAVLGRSGAPVELVEVKVRAILAGVGQLLGYCYGLERRPRLTLVIPWASRAPHIAHACELAGVTLWPYEDPEPRARRARFEVRQAEQKLAGAPTGAEVRRLVERARALERAADTLDLAALGPWEQ
jgi:hypothetical protein